MNNIYIYTDSLKLPRRRVKTKFTPCIGCSGSMVNLSRSVLMGKNPKIPTLKPPLKLHSCARKVIVFKRKGDCY